MKRITPKLLSLFVAFTLALGMVGQIRQPADAAGTINLNTLGTTYSWHFDSLASTGTSSSVPTGWDFYETGTNANTLYTAGTGSNNSGDTYSFGAAASTDRAFGALQSGSLIPLFGAQFTNNTGGTITSVVISYTGEMWRLGYNNGRLDRIDFQYSTDATSLTTGNWIDKDTLDFITPNTGGTAGLRDGNDPIYNELFGSAIAGLSIANGSTFWIRWTDLNASGADDGLAVDDFSITPSGTMPDAAPSVASTTPANLAANVAIDSDVSVTFSESVDVAVSWYGLSCTSSGAHTVAVSGGPTTYTLNPVTDFANGETCTITVYAAQISDQDTEDPPDEMVSNFSASFTTIAIVDTAPAVFSVSPTDGATSIGTQTDITLVFNEGVTIDSGGITVVCDTSSTHLLGVTGGPTTWTVNPTVDFDANEMCTVTVLATYVHDTDTNDPPDTMAADFSSTFRTDVIPAVSSTTPVNSATDVALDSNVVVNFSEAMTATTSSFTLSCTNTGTHSVVVSGSGTSAITLNPSVDFGNFETCSLTVNAAQISDSDAGDPPDNLAADYVTSFTTANVCALPFTPIYSIQGTGATVALTTSQTTRGVVVGDFEGASPALRGFFMQDPVGDGNPLTSDGIFVYESANGNNVNLGDLVQLTGTPSENQGQSQISSNTIINCGTGSVTPTDVSLPVASLTTLEQYEGMLVRFPQQLFVTEHFQLGRFGQVVLSSGDRLDQPTAVTTPGALANALQAANNLNKLILDDASQAQNPDPIVFARGAGPLSASNTLRGGDSITGAVGVMTYTWGGNSASPNAYRLRPINALNGTWSFSPTNPRPASPPAVGGSLTVVGMNLLNYFNTFDGLPDNVDNCTNGVGGTAADCRGADTAAEFDRQWLKTISAIVAMDPDVLGVIEIENDGYGSTSVLQDLIDKLNTATSAGKYAFIDVDSLTGQVNAMGTDAIKVGLIYQPGTVTPVGTTAVLNSVAFVNGGDASIRSRPSLLQAFEENASGARFMVDVNHLKSKGSACDTPDAGDGQGNCNVVRTNSANALVSWLATDPTGTGDPDIIILGDLNSYAKEDPIIALEAAGFVNATSGSDVYSYVFDGQWGYLDYTLISSSLVSQSSTSEWHINADEPSVLDYNTDFKTANLQTTLYAPDQYRISDHDPIITGLNLDGSGPTASLTNPANGTTLVEVKISELSVVFNKDVVHDSGQYAADNPNNYILVERGANKTFDTLSCEFGVQTDDKEISIDSVIYDPATFTAILSVNGGAYLPEGDYRLFVCGTSSIRDLVGNVLNNGAFDTISDFGIRFPVDYVAASELPATGFAPDRVTELPAQTVSYAALGDLWLEIPSLNVKTSIVGVPQIGNTWDVTWLGSQAGWLAGSAFPTALGNSVLTAHVWDALNKPGAFYALDKLGYGDRVIVHSYGKAYTYEVRRVMTVSPANVDAMLKHQDDAWLTLVTCKGYSSTTDAYSYRTLVRAVLVDVK